MSWFAQMRHVLWKDLREQWRAVAVYLVLVAIVAWAVIVTGRLDRDPQVMTGGLGMLGIYLVGMLAIASAVHADSPTRPSAFWMSRPLRPSAVYGAKLAFALLALVLPALVAQAGLLATYELAPVAIATTLGASLLGFVFLHAIALLLAAITRDTRAVALALVCLSVAGAMLVGVMRGWSLPILARPALLWTGVAGALFVPAVLYRRHELRWPLRASTLAALLFILGGARFDESPTITHGLPASLRPPGAAIDTFLNVSGNSDGSELNLMLVLRDVPESWRISLDEGHAHLTLADGSELDAPLRVSSSFSLTGTAVPDLAGIDWLVARPTDGTRRGGIAVRISPRQWQRLRAGVVRVDVDAVARVRRVMIRREMPLVEASEFRAPGARLRLLGITRSRDGAQVRIVSAQLSGGGTQSRSIFTDSDYGLVNRARREAAPLFSRGGGGSSFSMAAPGASLERYSSELTTSLAPWDSVARRDPAWYEGARLLAFEWSELGTYRLRASTRLRARPLQPITGWSSAQ